MLISVWETRCIEFCVVPLHKGLWFETYHTMKYYKSMQRKNQVIYYHASIRKNLSETYPYNE
jgi:hypothetical protein